MITKAALLTFRNNAQELLFVQPKGKEYFLFPGGKREKNETIEEALHREIDEELGVRVENVRKVGVVTGKTPDGRDLTMHLYAARLAGNPSPRAEIAKLFWLKRSDLPRYEKEITPIARNYVLPLLEAQDIW